MTGPEIRSAFSKARMRSSAADREEKGTVGNNLLSRLSTSSDSGHMSGVVRVRGNSGTGGPVALAAFLRPVVGFIAAIMADKKQQMAVKTGDFGDYRKCPFCAESIRKRRSSVSTVDPIFRL